MKKIIVFFTIILLPTTVLAKTNGPDCHSWPMNMTEGWLKNSGIVNITDLDETKTKYVLLASEKKASNLYNQIYRFQFFNKNGQSYEVITTSDSSYDECSLGSVNSYLISKKDINY